MPAKLFVGNLPENVDATKLKQIFQPYCKVTECDIVKNYAFVHLEEDDVDPIIARFQGYMIDGNTINIKKSTSKLRPTPGMPNRCFRCQSDDHRTPQCPQDPNNKKSDVQTIKINLIAGGGSAKRAGDPIIDTPKRMAYQAAAQSAVEAEIPQPADPDLQQLYQEYQLSRQRYVYYRDRLLKEMEAKHHGSTVGYALSNLNSTPAKPASTAIITSSSATQLSGAPVSYQPPPSQPQPTAAPLAQQPPPVIVQQQPNAPYMQQAAGLRAPYALPTAPYNQVQQPQPVPPPYGGLATQQPPPLGHGVHHQQQGVPQGVPPPFQNQVMTSQQYMHRPAPARQPPTTSHVTLKWS